MPSCHLKKVLWKQGSSMFGGTVYHGLFMPLSPFNLIVRPSMSCNLSWAFVTGRLISASKDWSTKSETPPGPKHSCSNSSGRTYERPLKKNIEKTTGPKKLPFPSLPSLPSLLLFGPGLLCLCAWILHPEQVRASTGPWHPSKISPIMVLLAMKFGHTTWGWNANLNHTWRRWSIGSNKRWICMLVYVTHLWLTKPDWWSVKSMRNDKMRKLGVVAEWIQTKPANPSNLVVRHGSGKQTHTHTPKEYLLNS